MGIQTSFHADQGQAFLGLRLSRRGQIEVVYDNGPDQRHIWQVHAQLSPAEEADLSNGLRIAAASPRVLPALLQEMNKRAITLEQRIN